MTGTVRADALRLPLRDDSVDLVVTSPPYYHVRDYGYPGQLGLEPTPLAYLEALWAATREMVRVLKPEGSIWVNLGDCYQAAPQGPDRSASTLEGRANLRQRTGGRGRILRAKSLHGLPWAYALGCTGMLRHLSSGMVGVEMVRALLRDVAQGWCSLAEAEAQLGLAEQVGGLDTGLRLILRRDQVWAKTNPQPESVRDRPHTIHEYWFLLTKRERYYAAADELREPYRPSSVERDRYGYTMAHFGARNGPAAVLDGGQNLYGGATHPLGRMPGSVWALPSERLDLPAHLGAEHYAAFGTEWPRRLVLGWSPPGICVACGQGRFPVVDDRFEPQPDVSPERNRDHGRLDASNGWGSAPRGLTSGRIVGYACACTPHTDHPGSGRRALRTTYTVPPGSSPRPHDAGRHQAGAYQRVGPWREYHLDRWTPPPARPAVVLDSFGGSGTTAMVAKALGRTGISVDLSFDYCRVARWRIHDPAQAAKVHARTNRDRQLTLEEEAIC